MTSFDPAYTPGAWSSFFSAQAGASAALAGLLFVAVSINLPRIVVARTLIARTAKGLVALMGVLVASTFGMVPSQPAANLGYELASSGFLVWIAVTFLQRLAAHKNPYISRRQKVLYAFMTQIAAIPFAAGGVSLIAGFGGGLYWIVGGIIFSFIAALIDAWVLLVEIQR
jgi:modulator of FtsH protease